MVEPAKDRIRNNVSEPLDRACVERHAAVSEVVLDTVAIKLQFMHETANGSHRHHDELDTEPFAGSLRGLHGRTVRGRRGIKQYPHPRRLSAA